jgi:hypothetical protein
MSCVSVAGSVVHLTRDHEIPFGVVWGIGAVLRLVSAVRSYRRKPSDAATG